MEVLNSIWQAVAPYLAGISFSGLISGIIYACLKGAFNRTISKINVEKIADQATEKGVEKVKVTTFKHSIQPLVNSELEKINEKAVEVLEKTLLEVQNKYDQLLNVLEKLSAFFENSIGVSEKAKEELRKAIEEAKNKPSTAESVVLEEVNEKTKNKPTTTKNDATNDENVIR